MSCSVAKKKTKSKQNSTNTGGTGGGGESTTKTEMKIYYRERFNSKSELSEELENVNRDQQKPCQLKDSENKMKKNEQSLS